MTNSYCFLIVFLKTLTFRKSLTFWARLAALVRISGVNSISYGTAQKLCICSSTFLFLHVLDAQIKQTCTKTIAQLERNLAQLERNFAQLERNFKKWYDTIPRMLSVRTQI